MSYKHFFSFHCILDTNEFHLFSFKGLKLLLFMQNPNKMFNLNSKNILCITDFQSTTLKITFPFNMILSYSNYSLFNYKLINTLYNPN